MCAGSSAGDAFAVAGAAVFDGHAFVPDQTVVASGGVITRVGPRLSTRVPEGRRQASSGVDVIKVYNGLHPAVYASIVAEARSAGPPVVGHVPRTGTLDGALALRQDLIAHSEEFFFTHFGAPRRTDIPVEEMRRYSPDYTALPGLALNVREAGTYVAPNLVHRGNRTHARPQGGRDRRRRVRGARA